MPRTLRGDDVSGLRLMIEKTEDERPTAVSRIYGLVRLAVAVNGRGEREDDYTGTVSLPMGTTWKTVDPYYGRVWAVSDGCEGAVEEETVVLALEGGLVRRLLAFDERIGRARDDCAEATFDESMDHIFPEG
jgi:hypothetical protein